MRKQKANININYINPFLVGANAVFNEILNVDLKRGKISLADSPQPLHEVIIKIELEGNANGYVLYSLAKTTVNKIAKALIPDISEYQFRREYKDIIGEFANMITGSALGILSENGLNISTPVVFNKDDVKLSNYNDQTVLVLKQYSPYGQIETTVVFRNK